MAKLRVSYLFCTFAASLIAFVTYKKIYVIDKYAYQVENNENIALSDEITIVALYVDLGTFRKGEGTVIYTSKMYKTWMKIFAKIKNPVIAFFADSDEEKYFLEIRASQPRERTKTVKFSINASWAFSLRPQIAKIISSMSYPKHHPNTVIPEYGCVTHAKYEMVAKAAEQNPFKTKYIAWLDIGYFRDLTGQNIQNASDFTLVLPPRFDVSKVAYLQINPRLKISPNIIFKQNRNLVGGGYFVGNISTILSWTSLYKKAVFHYLGRGLTNTAQQVVYAMLVESNEVKQKLQLYWPKPNANVTMNKWFYLGYLSRRVESHMNKI